MEDILTAADVTLWWSAKLDTVDKVRAALVAGGDDGDGATPLLVASYWNRDPAVSLYLIEQGTRLGVVDNVGDTVPHGFAHNGAVDLARLALSRGVPINGVNDDGKTALHYAASDSTPGATSP